MISKIKRNYKLGIAFILGILVSGGIVYAASLGSDQVSYDNTKSGMSATTMQQALDELYSKVPKKNQNFVTAYTYNSSSCITGEESSCKNNNCYMNKNSNSCTAGTIIEYKVNNSTTIPFRVMYDKGETMVMQSQNNIISSSWSNTSDASTGPDVAIPELEGKTQSWTNVNNQTYQMGTTIFAGGNAYTSCAVTNTGFLCSSNSYTWSSRTAKARMITYQELEDLGCEWSSSCPNWLTSRSSYYWTMSGMPGAGVVVGTSNIYQGGASGYTHNYGVRAVVEVSK